MTYKQYIKIGALDLFSLFYKTLYRVAGFSTRLLFVVHQKFCDTRKMRFRLLLVLLKGFPQFTALSFRDHFRQCAENLLFGTVEVMELMDIKLV